MIVAYDPEWAARFAWWRNRIRDVLGTVAVRIEHVGSTSVPGLAAKPTVDIQVSIEDLDAEDRYVPQLEAAGVQLRSRDDYHRFFRPFPDRPRDVHVHVCKTDSDWERGHLLFRDYLQAYEDARDIYREARRGAAELWRDDRLAYMDAKTVVILGLLEQAEVWEREARRSVLGRSSATD